MKRERSPAVVNPKHAQPARQIGTPEPGWFRMRLVKGGPMVGAQIRREPTRDPETGELLDRSWFWSAFINGEMVGDPGPQPSDAVYRIWTSGERIHPAEHDYLIANARWTEQHAPDEPAAQPGKPIDLLSTPLPF